MTRETGLDLFDGLSVIRPRSGDGSPRRAPQHRVQICTAGVLVPQLKVQRYGTEAESLRLKLLQPSQLEAASITRHAAKSAQGLLKPALSANPSVAARQQAAIKEIPELLGQLDSLADVVAKNEGHPVLRKSYQSITVQTAVLHHVFDFIPAALAACLIDLLMPPILLLKILVHTGTGLEAAKRLVQGEPPSAARLPDGCVFSSRCAYAEPACSTTEPALEDADFGHQVACRRWQELRPEACAT